jgi:hypothetical protein
VGVSGDALLAQDHPLCPIPSWHPFEKAVTPSILNALLFGQNGKGLYMIHPGPE